MQHEVRAQACVTIGADFFLVCQNGHSGIVRSLGVDFRGQSGVSAHLVILAIGTNQAAV